MQHMAAFGFSSTNTGAGVFVTLPAKQDGYLTVNANNRFIIPAAGSGRGSVNRIMAAYAQGTTMTVARVNNPTLRAIGLPSVPNIQPALVVGSAFNIAMFGAQGPNLPIADEFGLEADAAGIEVQTGFIWLTDGTMNIDPRPIFSLQFSATITTVANTWTAGTLTMTQGLPVGTYQVVGMDVIGATQIGARLVFPNGGPRPGCLSRASSAIFSQNQFRLGNVGNWGEFSSYAQPQIELFNSASGSVTVTGQLDLIKVA